MIDSKVVSVGLSDGAGVSLLGLVAASAIGTSVGLGVGTGRE